jgi:cysteine desulfuration protein SufE
MTQCPAALFGVEITAEKVISIMSDFQHWEDRYRQIIVWGKQLEPMPADGKSHGHLVSGCESQVWLSAQQEKEIWSFHGDSDARIVKGLIAIAFAALNHKKASEIEQFDVDGYFEKLGLLQHLSPSRGNGLRAIVMKIKQLASGAV